MPPGWAFLLAGIAGIGLGVGFVVAAYALSRVRRWRDRGGDE